MNIDPAYCVMRFCRNCVKPMTLTYEWDSEYRWYMFHCDNCGYDVSLGESINQDIRESNQGRGDYLEPLTKEEMINQSSPKSTDNIKVMFNQIKQSQRDEIEKMAKKLKHDISEKNLNDLK